MRVADSSYDSLFPFRCTLLPFPYKLNLAYRAPPPPPIRRLVLPLSVFLQIKHQI